MARDDDHARIVSEICAVVSRIWTGGRLVQMHAMPSVKIRSAREAAKKAESDAADRRAVRASVKCGSSSFSASERSGEGERAERSGSLRARRDLPYGEVIGDERRRSGCRDPGTAFGFPRRAKSSSDFGSSRRLHDRAADSGKNVPDAVIKATSPSTCRKDFTAKRNEYAPSGFPKYVVEHRGGVGNESKRSVILCSLEPLRAQAVNERVGSKIKDKRGTRFRQSRTKNSAKKLYYRRVFCGNKRVKHPVLKAPDLTPEETIRWEAMSRRVTSFDAAQRKRIAEFEGRLEISEGQPAAPKTAPKKIESRKREQSRRSSKSSGVTSSRETRRLTVNAG